MSAQKTYFTWKGHGILTKLLGNVKSSKEKNQGRKEEFGYFTKSMGLRSEEDDINMKMVEEEETMH